MSTEAKSDNLSAVLMGKGDLQLVQQPVPSPNESQVLIKMQKVNRISTYVIESLYLKNQIKSPKMRISTYLLHEKKEHTN